MQVDGCEFDQARCLKDDDEGEFEEEKILCCVVCFDEMIPMPEKPTKEIRKSQKEKKRGKGKLELVELS